jgi:hypothetical protein
MAEPIGINFKNGQVTGALQLVAPSANVNGVVLRTFATQSSNAAVVVSSGIKALTGYFDVTSPIIFYAQNGTLPYPVTIPAGQGLWLYGSGNVTVNATWDVL